MTLIARRWLPSRWTRASRSGTLHPRPQCSPSPSEEGPQEAGQDPVAERWVGVPIHAGFGLHAFSLWATTHVGNLQLGCGCYKEVGEGGREEEGQNRETASCVHLFHVRQHNLHWLWSLQGVNVNPLLYFYIYRHKFRKLNMRRKVNCTYPYFYLLHSVFLSDGSSFLLLLLFFLFRKTSLSHSFRVGVRAIKSLSFPSSENVLILPTIPKDNFTGYRNLGWQVFSLSIWKLPHHFLRPPWFLMRNPLPFKLFFPYGWAVVSLLLLSRFFFVFCFQKFNYDVSGYFFEFSYLELYRFLSFDKFGKMSDVIWLLFSSTLSFPSGALMKCMLRYFAIIPQVSEALGFFFPVDFLDKFIDIVWLHSH